MKRTLRNVIPSILVLSCLFLSCQPKQDTTVSIEKPTQAQEEETLNPEEEEIKAIVEKFLMHAGNYDLQAMDSMISDKANLGSAVFRDGIWKTSVSTIGEYFERAEQSEPQPYFEPVNTYEILLNKGQIAFVWADATLCSYGVPRTNNIDNFTLIKEDGEWRFINLSFTNTRLPEDLKKFDLELFAKAYSQVWSGVRPEFVAMFFEENGSLQVNDGEPASGREAIANVAQEFMTKFPDMKVSFDSLVQKAKGTEFHWTLTGTDADPEGKGHKVRVSGYEFWTMGEGNLIKESKGNFPSEEYNKQLAFGIE